MKLTTFGHDFYDFEADESDIEVEDDDSVKDPDYKNCSSSEASDFEGVANASDEDTSLEEFISKLAQMKDTGAITREVPSSSKVSSTSNTTSSSDMEKPSQFYIT